MNDKLCDLRNENQMLKEALEELEMANSGLLVKFSNLLKEKENLNDRLNEESELVASKCKLISDLTLEL